MIVLSSGACRTQFSFDRQSYMIRSQLYDKKVIFKSRLYHSAYQDCLFLCSCRNIQQSRKRDVGVDQFFMLQVPRIRMNVRTKPPFEGYVGPTSYLISICCTNVPRRQLILENKFTRDVSF